MVCVFPLAGAVLAIMLSQADEQAISHLRLGSEHLQRGETEQAVRECKAAVALDPQSASAHMLLGQAYLAQRSVSMMAEAKAEFQQALDLDPKLLWAHFYLAKVHMDLGRYDKAKQELELGLQKRPNVPHFLSLLGEVNRKLGAPARSLELNRKALEADASLSPAHYYMALAYMDLKNQDDAIRELEEAIDSKYLAPEMYLTLASQYLAKKRVRAAEELCRKAIALDPSRPEGHLNLAQLYNVEGASDKALAELRLAVPEGRSFPTTAYYQQVQADVFFETGRAYEAKHSLPEAIRYYSLALEYDPNQAKTHKRLAEVFAQKGDTARAREHASIAEKFGSAAQ